MEVFCDAGEVGEVEGLGELAFVGSVEEGGVVDEEAGALRASRPGAGEHEVVAENDHVADGFGAFAVDPVVEGVAGAGFGLNDEAAGRIVEGEGVLIEEAQFLFKHGPAFGEVAVGFDFEGGAFGFKGDVARFEFAQGFQTAAEVFELSDGLEVALLETGVFFQGSVGLEQAHETGATFSKGLDFLFPVCNLFCKALLGFHEEIASILDEPGVEGLDILQALGDMRGQDDARLGIETLDIARGSGRFLLQSASVVGQHLAVGDVLIVQAVELRGELASFDFQFAILRVDLKTGQTGGTLTGFFFKVHPGGFQISYPVEPNGMGVDA